MKTDVNRKMPPYQPSASFDQSSNRSRLRIAAQLTIDRMMASSIARNHSAEIHPGAGWPSGMGIRFSLLSGCPSSAFGGLLAEEHHRHADGEAIGHLAKDGALGAV